MADDEEPEPVEETYEGLRDLLYRLRNDAKTLGRATLDDCDAAQAAVPSRDGGRA